MICLFLILVSNYFINRTYSFNCVLIKKILLAPSLKTLGITAVLEHKWLLCFIETLPESIR
jgi:hypothetical protein